MAKRKSLSFKEPVYAPFLRRFTDERATDLRETINLHSRVTAAYHRTHWAQSDAIERVSSFIVQAVSDVVELPAYVPLGEAIDSCQHEILALETTIFLSANVDFSKPLSMKEQVDLNRFLRTQEYFRANEDRITELLVKAIGNVSAGIIQALPPIG